MMRTPEVVEEYRWRYPDLSEEALDKGLALVDAALAEHGPGARAQAAFYDHLSDAIEMGEGWAVEIGIATFAALLGEVAP